MDKFGYNKLSGPGANFINVLQAAFAQEDSKCAKRHSSHQCLFLILGPTSIKAVHKIRMKLTPEAEPIKLFYLIAHFSIN